MRPKLSIPNVLSVIRLLMVPLFMLVFLSDWEGARYGAFTVYALASMSDVLDGYLARRLGQITKLGRLLDPLADKLMGAAVLICIAIDGVMPWWIVAVFMVKEALMGAGTLVLYKQMDDVPASQTFGKLSVVFFFLCCVTLMLFPDLPYDVKNLIYGAVLFLILFSFSLYFHAFVKIMRKKSQFKQ